MKFFVYFDGNIFEGIDDPETTAEQGKKWLYENFEKLNKLTINLKGGGHLILHGKALGRCVIVIRESDYDDMPDLPELEPWN